MSEQELSRKDRILIALAAAEFTPDRLANDCIVTIFLSKEFIGNVDSTSGRWGDFIGKHLLFLKNHGTIHNIPVEQIEGMIILDLKSKIITEISLL